jgi:hypothetical protein
MKIAVLGIDLGKKRVQYCGPGQRTEMPLVPTKHERFRRNSSHSLSNGVGCRASRY